MSAAQPSDRFWNRIANVYARRPLSNPGSTQRKIEVITALLTPGHSVVDIGCGTGTIACRLAPVAGHVTGVDISAAMLAHGERRIRENDIGNVSLIRAPHTELCRLFEDDSTDVVCAFNILHLVTDLPALLADIHRILRPGGYFVSSTPCIGNSAVPRVMRIVISLMRLVRFAPEHVAIIASPDLLRAMTDAGFTPPEQPGVGMAKSGLFALTRKPPQTGRP